MAGASIEVRVEDKEVRAAFTRLVSIMGDTTPVMAAIGTGLVGSTTRRFTSQTDPEGQKWKALDPDYKSTKRNGRILTESGRLRSSINARPSRDSVRVGTNVIYAAIHQFGGTIRAKDGGRLAFMTPSGLARPTSVTLPARPYLGINDDDQEMIGDVVFGLLERAMR